MPRPDAACALLPAVLTAAAVLQAARAQQPDKSGFHLFNPTPRALLRDMMLDGPGVTESPYTVDAGHLQVEAPLFSRGSDEEREATGGLRQETTTTFGSTNFRLGLLSDLEMQVVLDGYTEFRIRVPGFQETLYGFGDTTVRAKYNVWGNDDDEATAFALMPYATLPTAHDELLGVDRVEGGLVLALGAWLPHDFLAEVTTRVHAGYDTGYHTEFAIGLGLGHTIVGNLDGYLEFGIGSTTEPDASAEAILGGGLIFRVATDVRLYAGADAGATQAAEDWSAFLGLAWRF